jgi:TolA-binding protein
MHCSHEDLIRFVQAELDVDDLERVVQHLEACQECAASLQVMVRLRANREELRNALEKAVPARGAASSAAPRWFAVAAAALILSVSGLLIFLLLNSRSQLDLPALASQERYPYRPMVLRGGDQAPAELFNQAMGVYQLNDVARASLMLEDYLFQSPRDAEAYFYLGVCHYLLGKYAEAVRVLETGLSVRTIEPEEKYHWYLAQAYLKMRRAAPARRELQLVVGFQGEFGAKAAAILKRLD